MSHKEGGHSLLKLELQDVVRFKVSNGDHFGKVTIERTVVDAMTQDEFFKLMRSSADRAGLDFDPSYHESNDSRRVVSARMLRKTIVMDDRPKKKSKARWTHAEKKARRERLAREEKKKKHKK